MVNIHHLLGIGKQGSLWRSPAKRTCSRCAIHHEHALLLALSNCCIDAGSPLIGTRSTCIQIVRIVTRLLLHLCVTGFMHDTVFPDPLFSPRKKKLQYGPSLIPTPHYMDFGLDFTHFIDFSFFPNSEFYLIQ